MLSWLALFSWWYHAGAGCILWSLKSQCAMENHHVSRGDIIYRSEDFPYLLVDIHFLMAKVFVDPSWPGLETHKNAPKLYIDVENLWISGTQMLHKWWINSTLNC